MLHLGAVKGENRLVEPGEEGEAGGSNMDENEAAIGLRALTPHQPGRLEAISQGRCDPADMEAAIREIVPFLCAGLAAPARR